MIRKGDVVQVITGKDKGKTGRVLSVQAEKFRVLVEKVNMVKRHTKPTQGKRTGGIVEKEAYINVSNVMFYDEKKAKPTRAAKKG
jgi:large subunit ribosomal protein L24